MQGPRLTPFKLLGGVGLDLPNPPRLTRMAVLKLFPAHLYLELLIVLLLFAFVLLFNGIL